MVGIAVELPNPLRQLLRCHGIFVVHPAEGFLVQMQLLVLTRLCSYGIQLAIESALGVLQLVKQFWTDGKQIASGQPQDLVHVPETRAHDLRLISVFLIVVVDARDGGNSRILVGRNLRATLRFPIPIINAADERGDQRHTSFSARHSLRKAEQERQIAVDAVFLENFGAPYALPGAGYLDQHAFAPYTLLFDQRH